MSKHIETKCVQEGWEPKAGEPRVVPIYQSTTFKYDTAAQLGDLFDLKAAGHFYTRLSNPTLEAVEKKIAALEGGVAAMVTSSGQAASLVSVLVLCKAGDHAVCSSAIYGGTYNLFSSTMSRMGIEFTFVPPDADEATLRGAVKENTKLIFGESLSNPTLDVLDIEMYAKVAHENNLPLLVDNTFPTPVNCRPFEFGADIVIHSTSKYMDGHAVSLGGAIVDSGNFNFAEYPEKYPMLCEPEPSYHGTNFTEAFGKLAYILLARAKYMRDLGVQMSPQNGFLLSMGLETLALRMERHCHNARLIAEYLSGHDKIEWVIFPGLESSPQYERAKKYMPGGTSGVISFCVKGGRENAGIFMESLRLACIATHVADLRTCLLHPASTTHRQLSDEQLAGAGIDPGLIRFSVGIEHAEDIIEDIGQALEKIKI
ncbi:MAG TPA: bifunctional O-acetylhomoserine aminocarboxypropyltransferase/cysteine synthase [Ruminococcaceae bacterium]|nr:bifunctional O-acetylhomoserine aminocarboxypropyltransferase/cysteine synthase [Oscillospiraceae bacterium]